MSLEWCWCVRSVFLTKCVIGDHCVCTLSTSAFLNRKKSERTWGSWSLSILISCLDLVWGVLLFSWLFISSSCLPPLCRNPAYISLSLFSNVRICASSAWRENSHRHFSRSERVSKESRKPAPGKAFADRFLCLDGFGTDCGRLSMRENTDAEGCILQNGRC